MGGLRLISVVPFKSCALCIAVLKAWFQNIFINLFLLGEISDYNLRNASNFSNFRTRTEVFRKSCLPSAVSLWNELSPNIKQCESFTTFQRQLKLHSFGTRKVPEYFQKGNRFLSVMHARIRNQCSNLNGDLFKNYLSNSKACSCGYETEDADHYFFNCNK